MALPRPALLGILGAVLILVTFVATHKGASGNGSTSSTPAPAQVTEHKPAPAAHAPANRAVTHSVAKRTAAKKQAPVKAKVQAPQEAGAALGLPLPVAQAFAKHQVVVLFFRGSGVDDALTADSVRALKSVTKRRGVAIFMDKLSNLAAYRRVVEGLDVSQAPSIVIVDRARKARLLDGFIDAGSLRQAVADVTR